VTFRRSQVSLATVFTVCLGVGSVVALVYFLLSIRLALTLALGSAMAAVAMDHLVEALGRRGLGRTWATVTVVAAATALLVGLGLLLFPPMVLQARSLVAGLPGMLRTLEHTPWFAHLDAGIHLEDQLRDFGSAEVGGTPPLLSAIGGVATAFAGILAFLFLAVFMLVFGRDLATGLFAELKPAGRARYDRMVANVYRSVGGYLGGLLGICAVNALLTTTVLLALGVPFFLPLGILSGASSLVPYAGPALIGSAITLFALISGGGWIALGVGSYFLVYGQLEGNILAPFVYRRTAHVNPLVSLLAVLFLAEAMGIAGAVVAVPAAAVVQVVFAEIVRFRREHEADHPAGG
jgi:predicted PurR-regulated permease PerM